MAELMTSENDRNAFNFAQSRMRAGTDVALLTVVRSNDVNIPVGAVCAVGADGETAGDRRWSQMFSAPTQSVLSNGDAVNADVGDLSVLIVRVG